MTVNRRDLLAAVAAGTGALAGCLTGGDGSGETTTEAATTVATTTTEEPTTTTTAEPTTTTSSGASVVMSDSSFAPRTVSIEPGTLVTWTNTDAYTHDVTSAQFNDGAEQWDFQSGDLGEGGQVSYRFEESGVYEYYCTVHGQSTMCGAVLVGGAEMAGDLPCSGGYG